ncbi:hypothetical protein BaRGS_00021278 [Batillaria attramentaria]|uniref:Uncharacterized protein n=1 Tax=Batillaria attramentaria TaxID=370345 RepID=A0ABD0KKD9_9CAEN
MYLLKRILEVENTQPKLTQRQSPDFRIVLGAPKRPDRVSVDQLHFSSQYHSNFLQKGSTRDLNLKTATLSGNPGLSSTSTRLHGALDVVEPSG